MKFPADQLRALAAVVDEGSFEAAAAELRVSGPAISQRIKALEASAGTVLIQRTRPARVTETGEVLLRLARQTALAEAEAEVALGRNQAWPAVRVAVNADSLATWALPALIDAMRALPIALELLREDETGTAELLRSGTAMAAVTTAREPVQGCRVAPLGVVRYHPVASPGFVARWFRDGATAIARSRAPFVRFDRKDGIPGTPVRTDAPSARPPEIFVPGSGEFLAVIEAGVAWGFVDDLQAKPAIAAGRVRALPGIPLAEVPLYWQQWRLPSASLDAVAEAIAAAARKTLAPAAQRS